jgi:hypothetical protein
VGRSGEVTTVDYPDLISAKDHIVNRVFKSIEKLEYLRQQLLHEGELVYKR